MLAIAGSFYLVSTYAFVLFCMVLGVRLVRLAQRNAARPELYLGSALFLMGGVGYGILITMSFSREWFGEAGMVWIPGVSLLGKALHDVGVLCMIAFVVTVFRPTETWARTLAGTMVAVLIVGYVGHALADGFRDVRPSTPWYWLGFATIGTLPFWNATEAFLYHGQMRKRAALGLARPDGREPLPPLGHRLDLLGARRVDGVDPLDVPASDRAPDGARALDALGHRDLGNRSASAPTGSRSSRRPGTRSA